MRRHTLFIAAFTALISCPFASADIALPDSPRPKPAAETKHVPATAKLSIRVTEPGQASKLVIPSGVLVQRISRKPTSLLGSPMQTVVAGLALSASLTLLGLGWVGRVRRGPMTAAAIGLIVVAGLASPAVADRGVPNRPHVADVADGAAIVNVTVETGGEGTMIQLTIDRAALTAALAAAPAPSPAPSPAPAPAPNAK
jgi:hypothetical protein